MILIIDICIALFTILLFFFYTHDLSFQSPAEKLSNLCLISPEMDLDQISKAIDPEEFVLESFKESSGAKSQPDGESSLGCPQKAESDLELECDENYV